MDLNKELKFNVRQTHPVSLEQDKICDYSNPILSITRNGLVITRCGRQGRPNIIEEYPFSECTYIEVADLNENCTDISIELKYTHRFVFSNISEKRIFLNTINSYNKEKVEYFKELLLLNNELSVKLLKNENIYLSTANTAKKTLGADVFGFDSLMQSESRPLLFTSSDKFIEFAYYCIISAYDYNDKKKGISNIVSNYYNFTPTPYYLSHYNYRFVYFEEFNNTIAEKYNKHELDAVTLSFCMIMQSIVKFMAMESYFETNNVDISVLRSVPINDVIDYCLDVYKIDNRGRLFDEVFSYLVCYIFSNNLFNFGTMRDLIDYCNVEADRHIAQVKVAALDGTILPHTSIASLIQKAKATKEKIHDYIISKNIQKLIADPSMENAVNNLIVMFPNKFIFNFLCYYYTRQFFRDGIGNTDDFQYTHTPQYQGADRQSYSLLMEFSTILSNRFHISENELLDTTWGVFNYFFIKKYSQKWLDVCCTGKVGERDYETYLSDCFNDDMISIHDAESIALFTYYYCTVNNGDSTNNFYLNQPTAEQYNSTIDLLKKYDAKRNSDNFEAKLFGNNFSEKKKIYYTIEDVDEMTGTEFEVLVANLFHSMRFSVQITKSTGDQGIDVIAEKNGIKYGIQAKCYSGSVGNSAIQEAVAGKQFYGLDKVFVVTNNKFTKSAIKLAQSNDVVLWDRNILTEKLMLLK